MAKRVYLCPSSQTHNVGVGAYGTEEARCRDVAHHAAERLRAAGVDVKMPPRAWATSLPPNTWLYRVVGESNAWAADVHVPIHTNAGPRSAGGTVVYCFPGSSKGRRLAGEIYKRVAPLSPGSDRGIQTAPVFYETRASRAPVAYLELAFHSNPADALSVIENARGYGYAVADGILVYLGIPLPASATKPATTGKSVSVPVPVKRPTWWAPMMRWVRRVRAAKRSG